MTPQERERMKELCRRVIEEKDSTRFFELSEELDELLGRKQPAPEENSDSR